MDIRRALKTAREWSQTKDSPLFRFYIKQMMVDETHKAEVLAWVNHEISWLEKTIKKQKVIGEFQARQLVGQWYGQEDVEDMANLLKVVEACPPGEHVEVVGDFS
jgi:neutral trehalase